MIKVSKDGGVKYLTIFNPDRRNAISIEDAKTLSREIERSWEEKDVDVVVITGYGDSFCSGFDLSTFKKEDISRRDILDLIEWHVEEFTSIIRSSVECPKPILGRINGTAVGFGCEMLYWFDYKIAKRDVYLYEIFPKRGLIPDGGGIPFLGKTLGVTKALAVLTYLERMSAEEAAEAGIINEITNDDKELDERLHVLIEKIRKLPQGAFSKIKKLMWSDVFENLETHLRYLRVIQAHQVLSPEFKEGLESFLQKKEPVFKKVF